ncbi:MAG: cupin domain-containing protein [Bacteroidia bacterium]
MNKVKKHYSIEHYYLHDDGIFPNNHLPVLHYKGILNLPPFFEAHYIRNLFRSHNWVNAWKNGIFAYHHYHSITHEALGVYKGKALLLLGGGKGIPVVVEKGDVLIIPSGVAHKNLNPENSVKCVGAYSPNKNYDMNYGGTGERSRTNININKVRLPSNDPVYGKSGSLKILWK